MNERPRAVITGAGSGMGLAVAKRLAARGDDVHSFDLQPPLEHVEGLTHHAVDVRRTEDIERAMEDVGGKIRLLLCNAGVLRRGGLFDTGREDFRDMLDINLLGSWQTLKTALEQDALEQDATVVQMCSTVGLTPAPKLRPYSLSKQLVQAYIQALREDRPTLKLKAVYPGAVKTPMTMKGFASEEEYDRQALANWGVVSTADEIAAMITALIDSEDATELVWEPDTRRYVMR